MAKFFMNLLSSTESGIRHFIKNLAWDPIYPVLLAVYPILFFYVNNTDELTIDVLYLPLLFSLIVTSLTYLLAQTLIFRSWHRTALALGAVILFFYFYKPVVNSLPHSLFTIFGLQVTRGQIVMPLSAMLVLLAIYGAFKIRIATLQKISQIGNVVSLTLVVFCIVSALGVEFNRATVETVKASRVYNSQITLSQSSLGYMPDIYYLIFDRYGGNKTFAQYYNYDNSSFTRGLEARGFYVAADSHTNYPRTVFSLSSSLNMDYIQNMVDMDSPNLSEAATLDELFNHHQVGQVLKKTGYTYYHLGNWYGITNRVQIADANILPKRQSLIELDDFSRNILDTTFYAIASAHYFKQFNPADFGDGHRELIELSTDRLQNIPDKVSPKFVVSHILLPHEPYVFDAECQAREEWTKNPEASLQDYLDQLTCANRKINAVVDAILEESEQPPIIIIQGDEGPWPHVNRLPSHITFKNASIDSILERNRILNAYYFPDRDYSRLYDSITPVNSFRIVFNQFFAQELPLLDDKLYVFYDNTNLFRFIDVTSQVEQAEAK